MIYSTDLDAVYIACPPPIQLDVAIFCLTNNIHVISEVSVAGNIADFERLEKAAVRSEALFYLSENYSYTPVNWSLRQLTARGFFGRLTKVSTGYIHDCAALTFDGECLSWRGYLRKCCFGNDYASHALIPALQILRADSNNELEDQHYDLASFDGPKHRLGRIKNLLIEEGESEAALQSDFNYSVLSSSSPQAPLVLIEHDILGPRPHNVVPTSLVGENGGWISGRFDGEEGVLYTVSNQGSYGKSSLARKASISDEDLFELAGYPITRKSILGWKLPFVLCFERIVESITLNRDDGCLDLIAQVAKFQSLSSKSSQAGKAVPYGRLK